MSEVTREEIDRIRTNDLKEPAVQQMLAGYLARAMQERDAKIGAEEMHELIRRYVVGIDSLLDRATELYNAGFRA